MMRYLSIIICSSVLLTQPIFADKCSCSPKQTSKAFTKVAKVAIPAVVFIKVQGTPEENYSYPGGGHQNPFDSFGDDFFNRFFGLPPKGRQPPSPNLSQGSGFLVSPDGYIMTNAHVVKGADKISVILNEGKELDAVVIGSDPHSDIAIIKIEGKDLPYLALGDSDAMDIGEWVVAIGSPFQLEASLTVGVISAKGRQNLKITDLEDFIQTDAAINPGNSGGPLLNLDNEVIGINTAIVSRTGGYMGIGFAIPSNIAKQIMKQIIDTGSVTRGFLGVVLQPVDKDIAEAFGLDKAEGALVAEVAKDSPADKAGIKQGDIILEYNKIKIKNPATLRNEVCLMKPGSEIILKVNRNGQILMLPVTLGTAADMTVGNRLGLTVDNLTPELREQLSFIKNEEGVVITKIKPGSASAQAGLHPGYVILMINRKKVTNVTEFNDALNEVGNSKKVLILVRQAEGTRFYTVKID